jgi:hypothetical protein
VVCADKSSCDAGTCVCQSPFSYCAGTCVNLKASIQNCGACGHACAAKSPCVNGECK